MGRTDRRNNSYVKSPVSFYVSFNGAKGVWEWWDKETKANVSQDELDFIVLDTRSSITGWHKKAKKNMFSNMVKSSKGTFIVRIGKEEKDKVAEGIYKDISDKVGVLGGKYTQNIFTLANIGGVWQPVNIQVSASTLATWMEFVQVKTIDTIFDGIVSGVKGELKTMGDVQYYNPVLTLSELPAELATKANDFYDNKLKPYLNQGKEAVEESEASEEASSF
jgi:hypothetical protein